MSCLAPSGISKEYLVRFFLEKWQFYCWYFFTQVLPPAPKHWTEQPIRLQLGLAIASTSLVPRLSRRRGEAWGRGYSQHVQRHRTITCIWTRAKSQWPRLQLSVVELAGPVRFPVLSRTSSLAFMVALLLYCAGKPCTVSVCVQIYYTKPSPTGSTFAAP